MNTSRKYTASGFLQKERPLRILTRTPPEPARPDWTTKDFLTWALILAAALVGLLVLWAPLMLAPLSEMTGAFIRLHQEQ